MKRAALLLLLALVPACDQDSAPPPQPPPPAVPWNEATRFLAQHECANGLLPVQEGCAAPAPAREGEVAYRRRDWSGAQISDAVLADRGGRQMVLQTFDFGDGDRAFGRFDEGRGDGADLIRQDPGGVSILMTEDGGAGVQFWQGSPCPSVAGWLLFDAPLQHGDWQTRTVRIGLSRDPGACPAGLGSAFTRWRLEHVSVPWRVDGSAEVSRTTLRVIVSEHFGGPSIEAADHLERFVFAEGVGKILWQRWEHADRTRRADLVEATRILAGSGRCPPGVPGPPDGDGHWILADCRLWTDFVRGPARSMPWPR